MFRREFDKMTGKVRESYTRFFELECDVCGSLFERSTCRVLRQSTPYHFCSRGCSFKFGHRHSTESREKISAAVSGSNNPFFGQKHDKVTLAKMSMKAKAAWACDDYRSAQIDRLKQLTGEKNHFFGKRHSVQSRKKMSATRSALIAAGKIQSGPRGWKGLYTSRKTLTVERYDSFFELLYMRILDDSDDVTFWTKKHDHRITYLLSGSHRAYVPDFEVHKLDGTKILVEIKGYENQDKLSAKMKALEAYVDALGMSFRLLEAHELEQLVQANYDSSIAQLRRKERRCRPKDC